MAKETGPLPVNRDMTDAGVRAMCAYHFGTDPATIVKRVYRAMREVEGYAVSSEPELPFTVPHVWKDTRTGALYADCPLHHAPLINGACGECINDQRLGGQDNTALAGGYSST